MRGAVERYLQDAIAGSIMAGESGDGHVRVNASREGLIVEPIGTLQRETPVLTYEARPRQPLS
jgi:hypothetical protein